MKTEDDLRFNKAIDDYVNNHRFLPRQWLVEKVVAELKTCRFLLLTAEPGFGKTIFMAHLANENPSWLRYFVQMKSLREPSNMSARQFLIDIGFQLATMHPDLMQQNKITIEIEQHVGNLNTGSDILGLSVGTLRKSPFYSQMVTRIQQETGTESGRVRAIDIDKVINDPETLPLADLQELALFGPARQYDGELIFLLDGLHEWLDVDSEEDILHWLTNHTGNIPDNVRFVLTTRPPDDRWLTFMRRHQTSLRHLSFERDDQLGKKPLFHNQLDRDVRQYAERLWQDETYQPYLSKLKMGQDVWVKTAVFQADGNLGYLDMVARSVDQAIARQEEEFVLKLLLLEETPAPIKTLFADFFTQIKDTTANERIEVEDDAGNVSYVEVWPALYEPLLRVLAAANRSLTFAQLHQQSKIQAGSEHTAAALDRLTPLLDQLDGRYKLYHPALKEYVLTQELI